MITPFTCLIDSKKDLLLVADNGIVVWLCSLFRHRSLDLSSPVVLIGETLKNSPDALWEEKLKCRPEKLENVSEPKPFKEQISLAIELANSLKHGRDGCDIQMVSCDEVPMDADDEIGSGGGSRELSDELCRQSFDPLDFDADSDGVLHTDEMEAESGFGKEVIMFDVADIQNYEQQIPRTTDPRFYSLASEPQQFSIYCNNSNYVEEREGSCSVQVAAGAPDINLSCSSKVAAIDSTAEAEDKEDKDLQPSGKVTFQYFVLLLLLCLLRPHDYSLVMCTFLFILYLLALLFSKSQSK